MSLPGFLLPPNPSCVLPSGLNSVPGHPTAQLAHTPLQAETSLPAPPHGLGGLCPGWGCPWVLRACDVLGDQDLAHGGARPRPSGGGRQLGAHSCFLGPTLRLLARRGSFKGVGSGGGETGSKGGPRKIILPLGLSACPEAAGQGREAWPGSPKEELRSPLLSDLPQGPRTLVCESALLAVAPAQTPAQAGQDHSAHTPLQPCGVSHLLSPSRSPPPSLGVAWALPSLCPLCLDERPYIAFLENVRAHA